MSIVPTPIGRCIFYIQNSSAIKPVVKIYFFILQFDIVVWKAYNVCMDTITINISMPKGLYAQAKVEAKKFHYNSIREELIRDSTRWWMNDTLDLTGNGFTPQFESMVLRREKQPLKNDIVWEGKDSFMI